MTNDFRGNSSVIAPDTAMRGRTVGWFLRKNERWWTVYWEDGETTSMRESELKLA